MVLSRGYFIENTLGEPIQISLNELELNRHLIPLYAKYNEKFINLERNVDVFLPTGKTPPIDNPQNPPYLSHAIPIRQLLYRGAVNFTELNRLYALAQNLNLIRKIDHENIVTIVNDHKYRNIVDIDSESNYNSWEILTKTHNNIDMIKRVSQRCLK